MCAIERERAGDSVYYTQTTACLAVRALALWLCKKKKKKCVRAAFQCAIQRNLSVIYTDNERTYGRVHLFYMSHSVGRTSDHGELLSGRKSLARKNIQHQLRADESGSQDKLLNSLANLRVRI